MSSPDESRRTMDIKQIEAILPHRNPFLLIDRILDFEPGVAVVGLKAVTMNEEYFKGHFPGHPVMPGVLITESMAQVAGVLLLSMDGNEGKLAYFTGIDKQRFRKPVVPGDLLVTRVEVIASRGSVGKVRAESFIFRLETSNFGTAAPHPVSRPAEGTNPGLAATNAGPDAATETRLPVARNHISCVTESDGRRERKLYIGVMEGELAAEGELTFALVDRAERPPQTA